MNQAFARHPSRPVLVRHVSGLSVVLALIAGCSMVGFSRIAQAQSVSAADEVMRFNYANDEFLCATVRLFDEKFVFLVDTGTSVTLIDSRFQNRLGLPVKESRQGQTASRTIPLSFYRSPKLSIVADESQMEIKVPFVGVQDFGSLQAALDQPVMGLIGMDFLKDHVLRIDSDAHYVALVRKPRDTPAEVKHIDFNSPTAIRPSIRFLIPDDQYHNVFIDTGGVNGDLSLEATVFRKLQKKRRIFIDGESVVAELGGFAASQNGVLDKVELGEIQLTNVPVESGAVNLIGLSFLERFETEFDFPNRKAYFRPGKRLHGPNRMNLSHFGVKTVHEKLVVAGCRGIAHDAGIRVDDVLVRIDGRPAREMTISQFRRLQCMPDTELHLGFERDGKTFDVSLNLKQPPNPFPDNAEGSAEPPGNGNRR